MRNFWKAILATLLLTVVSLFSFAQNANPWKFIPEAGMASKSQFRQITPQKYLTASLDVSAMKSILAKSPLWHTEEAEKVSNIVVLPMPDGSFERFRMYEAPVMHPDLQAKFPDIRSYAGIGIDDPVAYFRGDFTLRGFHGMIRSPEHSTVYIDPYSTEDLTNYQVYYRKDFTKETSWECHFDEIQHEYKPNPVDPAKMAGDCNLRTYRLALACTGEYAAFHGGTVPLVASAMTTTMNRVNGVFEQDMSIHMNIVANNNNIIFLNASTDPYTNTNGSTMLGQNQTTCDNVAYIGSANYDIGHVFSTGGGGIAGLGVVCSNGNKAKGVTGSGSPVGDAFDIDYVAHEMGHQFGGNHTFNSSAGSCGGGNRNASTAYEPGSASTIMGYAGICSPTNIQPNSDDYFHAISVQEIAAFRTGGGNACSVNTNINSGPTANAGADYTIPRSTPFILTGNGSDPNEIDVLTYTWEQMDLGASSATAPTSTQTTGPVFRSFKGTTSPSRYLPRLVDVANNVSPTWEVLPSVGRTLNFRLTVRDNHVGGGCTAEDNMVVTVNGTAGPFLVTSPNTAVSFVGGSQQTVTWDVASTNIAPINCSSVDVLMSTDGGLTYPYTLLLATPNDGSQVVGIPNVATTTARIMVRANGNIFYDISNANFTITTGASSFSINASPTNQVVCTPISAVYSLSLGAIGGFSGSVNMSVSDLPPGATASFSPNPVSAPGATTLTIVTTNATAGSYNPMITGTSGALSINRNVALTVNAGISGAPTLTAPINEAPSITTTPTFTWGTISGALTYQLQVSTSSGFPTTVVDATGLTATSYTLPTALSATTTYFWRVRAINSCATGPWSTVYSFTTGCSQTTASTNVPITIPSSGTINSTLTLSGVNGNIIGIKVKDLKIHHTWVGDMKATLKSPSNVSYVLFDQPGTTVVGVDGCSNNHMLVTLDDNATQTAAQLESTCNTSTGATPPPYAITGTYQPVTSFTGLNGTSPNGTWTLTIDDLVAGDGGSLQTWSLEFITDCTANLGLSQTFIQGYMNGSTMQSVLLNSGVAGATGSQCDTITVALHASTSPYAQVFSKKTVLSTTGTTAVAFPPSTVSNNYYVVIKGRNLVETWSALPLTFSFNPTYNFGSAGQAYGSNLGSSGGIPVIYNADIDAEPYGDGEVNLVDFGIWELGNFNGQIGYYPSDLNGDGEVNLSDFDIWEINNLDGIIVIKP